MIGLPPLQLLDQVSSTLPTCGCAVCVGAQGTAVLTTTVVVPELPAASRSPAYAAVTVFVPTARADVVSVAVQGVPAPGTWTDCGAAEGDRGPPLTAENVTLPVGVTSRPPSPSTLTLP